MSLRDACMEADGPIAHVLVAPWGVGPFTTATRRTCSRTSWPSDQLYVMGNLAYMLYGLQRVLVDLLVTPAGAERCHFRDSGSGDWPRVASNAPQAAAGRWSRMRRSEPCLAAQLSQGSWCRGVGVISSAPTQLLVVARGRGAHDFASRWCRLPFE